MRRPHRDEEGRERPLFLEFQTSSRLVFVDCLAFKSGLMDGWNQWVTIQRPAFTKVGQKRAHFLILKNVLGHLS